ncbi:YbaK/EbsC family protein [Demequina capsici]|uniref:YbaK/EbsC family protein n=1 Tax=Demequina capsici TaxID=3075620 RepID=A0AA96F5R2_9MICO|nr:YbaK/EbsC family protein [Demequina sp. OYTSA14]WNM23260.1 YbaK/EbsC family protein [Demequina sp. OYTSA14]
MAMNEALHPRVQQVQAALHAGGVDVTVRQIDESTPTAAAAADYLGCDVGAIANSLLFMADDEPILVLTSGAHRVDTGHLAERIGAARVRRASADQVVAATGQVIGGVAPVGHPAPIRTYLDVALLEYDELWAAAGIPASLFAITYAELLHVTGAIEVEVD